MSPDHPPEISTSGGRVFATHPAAVVVAIVNEREELLLLESPRRPGWWEPVNGAVEAGETLLEAALREVREEAGAGPAGAAARCRPRLHVRLRRPRHARDQRHLPDGARGRRGRARATTCGGAGPLGDHRRDRVRSSCGSCRRSTSRGSGSGRSTSTGSGSRRPTCAPGAALGHRLEQARRRRLTALRCGISLRRPARAPASARRPAAPRRRAAARS